MRLFSAVALTAVALLATVSIGAQAQTPSPTATPEPAALGPSSAATMGDAPGAGQGRALTASDLEPWLDGFMPYALKRGDVAGAVVVVVKDGQVLLQKGYGYADVAKRKPVDPATAGFRPGSTAKLITWTAVMQQVERGKIDLDADINTYLDFEVSPGPGGKPITMRDLMTHTGGFEEAAKNLIITDPEKLPTLEAAVKAWVPTRIFAAGSTPAYSNYGTALAGYIVQRVSGVAFDDYVEKNIFAPLGMTHTSFRAPPPPEVLSNMANGYKVASSGKAEAFEYIPFAPAGSMATTGPDMARFMIAHLQDGELDGVRILEAKTAQMMHDEGRTHIAPLHRMALGFYESNINGRRVISHAGDLRYFHTDLHLFLDEGVGLFISMNSAGKGGAPGALRGALFREFADRYFEGPSPDGKVDPKVAAEHAKIISGRYSDSRRVETSLVSVLGLLGQTLVTTNPDGTISVKGVTGLGGAPKRWREISPFVWAEVGGKARLAAEVKDGKVVRFGLDEHPYLMFSPTPLGKSAAWLAPASIASFAILVLTIVMWPTAAIIRRRYGERFKLEGREATAYRLVRVGAIASAAAISAWVATIMSMMSNYELLTSALDPWLMALHVLGTIGVLGGLALALWNLVVVWGGKRSWFAKLWSLLLVLSTAVLAWLAVAFHLVGLSVNY